MNQSLSNKHVGRPIVTQSVVGSKRPPLARTAYTLPEAVASLGLSRATVRRHIADGVVVALKFGGCQWLVSANDLARIGRRPLM